MWESTFWQSIFSLLWALFVTCLILALAYFATRFLAGRMATGGLARGRRITVLEQTTVGKDQKLLLVRLDDRVYFLAVTAGGACVLRELTEEENDAWQASQPLPSAQADSFAQALRRVMEQRKK